MKNYLLLLISLFFISCGGGGSSSSTPSNVSIFNSNLLPVTSGSWYKPSINTSWQWQLSGVVNTSYNVDIYNIDLFDSSSSLISSLQASGKKVICYFSAGTYENWRSDKDSFPSSVIGNALIAYPNENWLDISNESIAPIMKTRLDLAVQKGCDGVEPDNMDNFTQNTSFSLSANDQLAYNKFIANEARKRGLSVGLKNDLTQVNELEPYFDFAINEQCHEYNECNLLVDFTNANKPIFNAEYKIEYQNNVGNARDSMCTDAINNSLKTLVLSPLLNDSYRYSCN